MNEEIERMGKKIIISLNEYLELENIKKCHEENMKVIYGKVIIPPEDLEGYRMLEHNWNELKRVLKEMYIHTQYTGYLDIIYKMQELERGEE